MGSKKKKQKQIQSTEQGYVVKDGLETGNGNIVPLWPGLCFYATDLHGLLRTCFKAHLWTTTDKSLGLKRTGIHLYHSPFPSVSVRCKKHPRPFPPVSVRCIKHPRPFPSFSVRCIKHPGPFLSVSVRRQNTHIRFRPLQKTPTSVSVRCKINIFQKLHAPFLFFGGKKWLKPALSDTNRSQSAC